MMSRKKSSKESNMQWVRRKLRPRTGCLQGTTSGDEDEGDNLSSNPSGNAHNELNSCLSNTACDTQTSACDTQTGASVAEVSNTVNNESRRSSQVSNDYISDRTRPVDSSFVNHFRNCFSFRNNQLDDVSLATSLEQIDSITYTSNQSGPIEQEVVESVSERQLTERDARALLGRSPCSSPLISRRGSGGSHQSMGAGPSSATNNAIPLLNDVPPTPCPTADHFQCSMHQCVIRHDIVGFELQPSVYRVYPHVHYLTGDTQWYTTSPTEAHYDFEAEPPANTATNTQQAMCVPHAIHTQVDYVHHLVPSLSDLTNLPCYWGVMDRYAAEALLAGRPNGTFLLRDSAQPDYLYSVSFRRYDRSLHARVEQWQHRFSFDSHDPGVYSAPAVTALLDHYKDPGCCLFFEPMLTAPLTRNFAFSLQHLCRAAICDCTSYDGIDKLPLPVALRDYLKYYHYKQMVRVRHLEHQPA